MATIAGRMHDLELFGRFSWRTKTVHDAIALICESLAQGIAGVESLAQSWDAEQRANGLSRETRVRRRQTLRSFVSACVKLNIAPKGCSLDPLPRDPSDTSASIVDRMNDAITLAIDRHRHRDVAILTLVWECGAVITALQSLRVGDLPIVCSTRCAFALSALAGVRSNDAYVFSGRHGAPLSGATIYAVFANYNLPGLRSLARARQSRLRELACSDDSLAPRMLAGEI